MFKSSLALLMAAPLLVISCSKSGSGSGSGSNNSSGGGFGSSITSQFIDAPVKGLSFKNEAGVVSQTLDAGKFSCKRGELIEFSLGGLDLGYASCGQKIFVHDLVSNNSDFTWNKAASVIQSFAQSVGGVLDLSGIDKDQFDLSTITYADADFMADLGDAHIANSSALPAPTTVVSLINSASAANGALAAENELPSQLDLVLGQLVDLGSKKIILKGSLVSGTILDGEEWCSASIDARSTVTDENGVYKFNVEQAASYDGSSSERLNSDGICLSENDSCEMAEVQELPKPKIITGLKTDMVFASTKTEPDIGGNVTSRKVLSLDTKINDEDVDLTGVFDNKSEVISGPLSGTKINCRYNVSTLIAVETSDEDDAQAPVNGSFEGALTCNEGEVSPPLALSSATAAVVIQAGKLHSYSVTGNSSFATSYSGTPVNFVREPIKNDWMASVFHQTFTVQVVPGDSSTIYFDIYEGDPEDLLDYCTGELTLEN